MDSPIERREFCHVSLRIPKSTKLFLETDAKRQNSNFNSLVSKILAKYSSFDKITEFFGAIPLDGLLFSGMLEEASTEHLQNLGRELGTELVKETLIFLNLDSDIQSLIRNYFEPMSSFSGWYSFSVAQSSQGRRLMFKHTRGPKWSTFLAANASAIIKTATGVEPRVTTNLTLVCLYC